MAAITFRQLQIFAGIVRHGSFRRCAAEMQISQVAVADHVRELEARLGHALFERRPGGPVALTAAGQRAQRHVVRILDGLDGLLAELEVGDAATGPRTLRLGMHAYLLRRLQPAFKAFEQSHPALKLSLDLGVFSAAVLGERLQRQTLDGGYFYSLDVPTYFESTYAWSEPLALFVGSGHPLARQAGVTLQDLAKARALQLDPQNPLRAMVDECLRRIGLPEVGVALETADFGLMLTSLQQGQGFVCMFEDAARSFIDPASIVRVPLEQPLPSLQVRWALGPAWQGDPQAGALMQALRVHHRSGPETA